MGVSHSVNLNADQDSPTDAGQKSVITDSLDGLDPAVTSEQFMAELIEHWRWPIDPTTEAVLKSCTVTDNAGADDFTVKVILDGAKLKSYGYGREDGIDRVRSWRRIVVDRAAKRITATDYVSEVALGAWLDEAKESEEGVAKIVIQMLEGPTRAEIWVVDAEGNRLSGEPLVGALYFLTDRVVGAIQDSAKAKVKVQVGQAIKHAGEKSVVSGPMEEHVDYDTFFAKLVACLKDRLQKAPNAECEEPNSNELITRITLGEGGVQTYTLKCSEASGEIVITHVDHEGNTANTSFRQVHKSPLVVEGWNITLAGDRTAGEAFARLLQKETNEAIDRANSWFG